MSKLFALEDIDNQDAGTELIVTPEEGEAADVEVNVDQDAGEIAEQGEAIDEGLGATDQLDQVEEVVEAAAEGDGLEPVAAEAIRIAIEAICARVGANPKSVYSLYATENFSSASARKAHTRIALEGVSDFLKDMWKKIKAALTRLRDKARAFWDNHVSSLGRIKKALMSAKDGLGNSSGKLKDKAYIEDAPGFLKEAFGFKHDISVAEIKKVVKTHATLTSTADQISQEIESLNQFALSAAQAGKADFSQLTGLTDKTLKYGDANAPMVGGVFVTFTGKADDGGFDLEIEREQVDREGKLGVSLSDKAAVQDLIRETIHVVDDTIRYRDKTKKIDDATSKFFMALEKRLNELSATESPESVKEMRKILKSVYKANAKGPQINAELVGHNVKLGKAVLGYVALCVKNYK